MEAEIKLTRYISDKHDIGFPNQSAWPLVVRAEGTNIPSEIFVHQITQEGDLYQGDIFRCIASVNDLYEIPKDRIVSSEGTDQVPYYRTEMIQFFCRNPQEVETLWERVKSQTADLIRNYNSFHRLKNIDEVTISEGSVIDTTITTDMQTLINLDFKPAGEPDIVSGEVVINNPDPELTGWLPVSEAPTNYNVPAGARFFYNIDKNPALKELFPVKTPRNVHLMHYEGVKLPYGIVYRITENTIYWMDFNTGDVAFPNNQNVPWGQDFIDRNNPGTFIPQISILIFS